MTKECVYREKPSVKPPSESLVEPVIETRHLEVLLGGSRVLGPLDLHVARGAFLGILGPNGSGKTTLLRRLSGGLHPTAGEVLLLGLPLPRYNAAEIARLVAVVPQQFNLDFNFTVEETVAMGRYVHLARFRPPVAHHKQEARSLIREAALDAVAQALEATGLSSLADRLITQLSGGERQRAVLAQALAQDTPILLLDEPLNNLDLNHQLEVMQLLARLHAEGRTILAVLHDLNIAAQYCNELLLLHEGKVFARGAPADILDPEIILEVFKVRVAVHRHGRRPYMTPLWSRASTTTPAQEQTPAQERKQRQVHVMAGGGAASELIEELVVHGFAPSVGIVSVFDTDYTTAERYGLRVVSAPPFEPYPGEAVTELEELVRQADIIIVAPIFFGKGNLPLLDTALRALAEGKQVIVLDSPPMAERDLSGGEAARTLTRLLEAGAVRASESGEAVQIARERS